MGLSEDLIKYVEESKLDIPITLPTSRENSSFNVLVLAQENEAKKNTQLNLDNGYSINLDVYLFSHLNLFAQEFSDYNQIFIHYSGLNDDIQNCISYFDSIEIMPPIQIYSSKEDKTKFVIMEPLETKSLGVFWKERDSSLTLIEQIIIDLKLEYRTERLGKIINWSELIDLRDYRDTVELYLLKTQKSIKAKKQITHQEQNKIQLISKEQIIPELERALKTKVQNQIGFFQKGLQDKIKKVVKPDISQFWKEANQFTNNLKELEKVKGAKRNYFGINLQFEENFYDLVRSYLLRESLMDSKNVSDTFDILIKEVNQTLVNQGSNHLHLPVEHITPYMIEDVLAGIFNKGKEFEANQSKKGVYEYFMAIRKYQMIAMMFFSAVGLSFFSKFRLYFIPITLALMGFGGYQVYKSVKAEREEEGNRQLKKAKQHLMSEAKRIGSEYSRSWQTYISDFLKQIQQNWMDDIETEIAKWKQRENKSSTSKKNKIQRSQSSYETKDRMLESLSRNLNSWDQKLVREVQTLKNKYHRL